MTYDEILTFMNAHPVFFLATVNGDKPYVRGMVLYRADEHGIIFGSRGEKDLHRQLAENPAVELCFYNPRDNRQVRVAGAVEYLEDPDVKADFAKRFSFLSGVTGESGVSAVTLYRLRSGMATVWTPEADGEPKEYVNL